MVSPLSLGSRNCSWWIALLVVASVCRTLAAPQDRITIKVATSFGAGRSDGQQPTGRALSEPIIITEPQPGQEFVFISANPSPAARTARLNSQVVQQPFVRIESGGVLDQDGILVAEHVAEHQVDTPIGQFAAPVQQDTQNWAPLSGPLVEEAVPAKVEEIRQGKAIDSASQQEEEVNLIPAESVSSRTVIKKAPNGQDYEYEYLYYDVEDVAGQNDTIVNTIASEPTLFSNNDQESLAVNNNTAVSEEKQESLTTTTTEGVTDTLNQDDLVQEIPQVSKVAFIVGDLSDPPAVTDQTINPQDEEEIINTVPSTVATTEATTTTTTEASTKRRRPTKTTTTTTVAPSGGSSRIRGKNRFSIDSIKVEPIANAVGPSTKAEGSGRRRISKPATSTLESRAGLAQQVRSQAVDLGGEELVEISQVMEENTNQQVELDFSRQAQTIERFPINSRFPPRLQENQEQENDFIQFQDVQERTPLRVVESSSFRNPGNINPAGDQVSVGRLTVLSGPARLPPPLVAQEDSDILQEEPNVFQVRPTFTLDGPVEEKTESGLDQEIDNQGAIIQTIQPETVVDQGNQQEEIQKDNNNVSIINRPELIDLLAFSAAAEQQQQDDHLLVADPIQQEVEEVLIEEITTIATPLAATTLVPQQQQPIILVADTIQAEDDGLVQMDDKEIVGLEEELAVTTVQPVQQQLEEIVPVEQSQAEIGQQPELSQVAVKEELKTTENPLEDVTQQQQVLDVKDFSSDVEQVSSESPTTTATTTTTTTTTTTATPTTIEMTTVAAPTTTTTGSRIRGPSRFSGSSNSNANRFNNRIRNRNRGDASNSSDPTTTTSTTTAPVRKNTFRPAGSPFNRLRRPFTTESPKVSSSEAADSPSSTDVIDTLEMNKESSSSAPSTTRRPLPPNIRNRFSARRNQTGNEIKSSNDEPRPTLSRPKPVSGTGQQQSNRIAPPRPMSPLLNRRRFSTTTTTTTTTESGLVDETNSTSSAEIIVKEEMEANITGGVEGVVVELDTESTTTTTTARPAGINRLRTRVPLSVSERPKTIRTQVSLNDRRNRFSALANNRKSADAEENKEEVEIKLGTSEVVQQQPEELVVGPVVDDSLDNQEGSNVDEVVAVLTTTTPSVKSRRPGRIPGQLAARRTLSS